MTINEVRPIPYGGLKLLFFVLLAAAGPIYALTWNHDQLGFAMFVSVVASLVIRSWLNRYWKFNVRGYNLQCWSKDGEVKREFAPCGQYKQGHSIVIRVGGWLRKSHVRRCGKENHWKIYDVEWHASGDDVKFTIERWSWRVSFDTTADALNLLLERWSGPEGYIRRLRLKERDLEELFAGLDQLLTVELLGCSRLIRIIEGQKLFNELRDLLLKYLPPDHPRREAVQAITLPRTTKRPRGERVSFLVPGQQMPNTQE